MTGEVDLKGFTGFSLIFCLFANLCLENRFSFCY